MKAFILATGPSMTMEIAENVRGKGLIVAVSDAFRMAPWADALVSADATWWAANSHAHDFVGRKFSAAVVPGIERMEGVSVDSNSGLLAIKVAVMLGATKVILLGFDMDGTHFFGKHLEPLENTAPHRFESFKRQFAQYHPDGVEIINATKDTALLAYVKRPLESVV